MTKTPKRKSVKKEVSSEPHYSITLTIGKETYTGKGKTLYDALVGMPRPLKIFMKSVLTITDGTKTLEQPYAPVRAKRLFYPLARPILARQLTVLFNAR